MKRVGKRREERERKVKQMWWLAVPDSIQDHQQLYRSLFWLSVQTAHSDRPPTHSTNLKTGYINISFEWPLNYERKYEIYEPLLWNPFPFCMSTQSKPFRSSLSAKGTHTKELISFNLHKNSCNLESGVSKTEMFQHQIDENK